MTVIVSKCSSGNATVPVIGMNPVLIRERFMQAVEA
jgi:sulfopyruvate decarboxylase subunit beta